MEVSEFVRSVIDANCGLVTMKFSRNNPLDRSKPPLMICPAGCALIGRVQKARTAAKSPFAMFVRKDAWRRKASDPVTSVPTTPMPVRNRRGSIRSNSSNFHPRGCFQRFKQVRLFRISMSFEL
jgi:hypothetical protein